MSEPDDAPEAEILMIALLRRRIEAAIDERGEEWAAQRLHISRPGVEAIMWRRNWSIETAVRTAGRLGVLSRSDVETLADAS